MLNYLKLIVEDRIKFGKRVDYYDLEMLILAHRGLDTYGNKYKYESVDLGAAFDLTLKLANHEDLREYAFAMLGDAYLIGLGTNKDEVKARFWYNKAVQTAVVSHYYMGGKFLDGKFIEKWKGSKQVVIGCDKRRKK